MQIQYLDAKSASKLMKENKTSKELLKYTRLSEDYKKLQNKFYRIRINILGEKALNEEYKFNFKKYDYDLLFGLELYCLFREDYKDVLSMRQFGNNSFWIYLSVNVIPDIVSERWGENNTVRSYEKPRRIWLSTLWWYIHLSWQGDKESTYLILKNNSTDHILNLVERSGRGYDIGLYRTLMKYYSKLNTRLKIIDGRQTFRSLLVLNTLHVKTLEPILVSGGYDGYIEYLFKKLGLIYTGNQFLREG